MARYGPLPGRSNQYIDYSREAAGSTEPKRKPSHAQSVTNTSALVRLSARLTLTDIARRERWPGEFLEDVLGALELTDSVFEPRVLERLKATESERDQRFKQQNILS